ncbi:MAG: CesD/SycD/LcrH family type III secretion system chaperone [Gammaproteobacteria bacterium]|nr:CesD/SycD/LcrH family type III secretion system chaperone [Gammaproteobacteria bacterium]
MDEHSPTSNMAPDAEAVADTLDALTDAQLLTVEELAGKCLEQGATLADVRGYTDDEMEAVYSFAHNAFQQRKYGDASKLFYFLAENDHTESRFWMGLGASLQMTGGFEQALAAYGVAAVLDATNPQPPLRACECYLALQDLPSARKALDAVALVCDESGGAAVHGDVLKRAAVLGSAVEQAPER